MIVPSFIQLFGPVQFAGALNTHVGGTFTFPGAALTASTAMLRFDMGLAPVAFAQWVVVWTPINPIAAIRLVHFDDGPQNIVEMARIQGQNSATPLNKRAVVTEQINWLVDGRVKKNIGFQVQDDNVSNWTLFEVCLELHFSAWNAL